jgi:hypothetical protein
MVTETDNGLKIQIACPDCGEPLHDPYSAEICKICLGRFVIQTECLKCGKDHELNVIVKDY